MNAAPEGCLDLVFFLLRPRPMVVGGVTVRRRCVSGVGPTSVRGSVYWGPLGQDSLSIRWAQRPCPASARRGVPVMSFLPACRNASE